MDHVKPFQDIFNIFFLYLENIFILGPLVFFSGIVFWRVKQSDVLITCHYHKYLRYSLSDKVYLAHGSKGFSPWFICLINFGLMARQYIQVRSYIVHGKWKNKKKRKGLGSCYSLEDTSPVTQQLPPGHNSYRLCHYPLCTGQQAFNIWAFGGCLRF